MTKRKVLKYARTAGCDVDGDIITINGTRYYVDLFNNYAWKTSTIDSRLAKIIYKIKRSSRSRQIRRKLSYMWSRRRKYDFRRYGQ